MIKLNIKALSVNKAFQGRRFKTPEYNKYINDMMLILPPLVDVPTKNIRLKVDFGYSSKLSDIDNGLKLWIDCLVKKYGFDDRYIVELHVTKTIVNKGEDHIEFTFY
jgi:Holliday junction resolvase RusA-like endonuclease